MTVRLPDDFARAFGDHFGLRMILDLKINLDRNQPFSATVTFALTPEHIEGIGKRMREAQELAAKKQAESAAQWTKVDQVREIEPEPPATPAELLRTTLDSEATRKAVSDQITRDYLGRQA